MICSRCRKTLREGEVCSSCVSSKSQCTGGGDRNENGSMDDMSDSTGYHWTCALCRHPAVNLDPPNRVVSALNSITEKFELMNKVQLPKLSSDLSHLRSITERIAGQNDSILHSIKEMGEPKLKDRRYSRYRRRKLTLPKVRPQMTELPTVAEDRLTRNRDRQRRSMTLQDLLLVINRKLHQASTSSKQR